MISSANLEKNNWNREIKSWASLLQSWGLAKLVSTLLENGGAFNTLAAQSLYICQPFLEPLFSVKDLADLLDEPERTQEFVKLLREGA